MTSSGCPGHASPTVCSFSIPIGVGAWLALEQPHADRVDANAVLRKLVRPCLGQRDPAAHRHGRWLAPAARGLAAWRGH